MSIDNSNVEAMTNASDTIIKSKGLAPIKTVKVDEDGKPSVVLFENTQKVYDSNIARNVQSAVAETEWVKDAVRGIV